MNTCTYKGYDGTVEVDMPRGLLRGKLLFVSDLVTYEARDPCALQTEFEAAVDDYLETCAALGKNPDKPLKGSFNVRIAPDLHKAAVLRAQSDGITLNEVVSRSVQAYIHPVNPHAGQNASSPSA